MDVRISADVGRHLQDFQVCQNVQCATLECSDFIILQESKKVKLDQPFWLKLVVQNDLKICLAMFCSFLQMRQGCCSGEHARMQVCNAVGSQTPVNKHQSTTVNQPSHSPQLFPALAPSPSPSHPTPPNPLPPNPPPPPPPHTHRLLWRRENTRRLSCY